MIDFYYELKITGIRDETSDTRSFILQSADKSQISYKPGQFLTLAFRKNDSEVRRSYSISSTPDEPLTITVKRVPNGEFSRYIMDYCRVGQSLYTIGASGFFVLPTNPLLFSHYVFYAAGSGITPILPLVKTILYAYPSVRVYLTYSNHSAHDVIFGEEIISLEQQYPSTFRVEWLYSDAKHLLKARLTKSLVEMQVNDRTRFEKNESLFFLCGPHYYMQMITITLLRESVSIQRIRKEIFDTIKPVLRRRPPDENAHQVTIFYRAIRYDIEVQYPETILETAKRNGVKLPYSCEAGKCGTCAATCQLGEVWMSSNEVLLDKELREGRVLTCTGYPVKGDVVLYYPAIST